jgi:hypothetical protein
MITVNVYTKKIYQFQNTDEIYQYFSTSIIVHFDDNICEQILV